MGRKISLVLRLTFLFACLPLGNVSAQVCPANLSYDVDGDGYAACVDCDDNDPSTHPGAAELCDGIDNDCDGSIDEDFLDNDGIADCINQCPMVVDFDNDPFGNPIVNGSDVSLEYWNWGVGSIVTYTDPTLSVADPSVAWDSSYPPLGFEDLGTPNEYYGGPGIGDGGWYGEPGENDSALGNNLQALAGNTWYIVNFNTSTCVHSIDLVDVDGDELAAQVILFDVNIQTVATYNALNMGDNSVETVELGGTCGVHLMMIDFYGTGAWDNLTVCVDSDGGDEICDGIDNDGDGAIDEDCEPPEGDDDDDDDDSANGTDPSCGCSTTPGAPGQGLPSLLGILLLTGLGLRLRRR
jgi:MYXO-CTERM domain-containing protein